MKRMTEVDTIEGELRLRDAAWMASGDARTAFRAARQVSPIIWHEGDNERFRAVFRHRDISEISRRGEAFSTARGILLTDQPGSTKGVLLWTDPPEHRRLRRYVNGYFSPAATARMAPWLREQCAELIARGRNRDSIDFVSEIAADLPLNTISEMLGVPKEERARFLRLANRIFDEAALGSPEDYLEAMTDLAAFGIEMANANHEGDLFSAMRSVEDAGAPLDDEEFGAMFMQIAGAAVETTRTMMGSIVRHLADDPTIIERIHDDPALARSAVEEFLRFYPPMYYMRRTVTAEAEVGGVSFRPGEKVLLYYLSANFDEELFEDPETFDIGRKRNQHLTFGTGEHVCLGLLLARAELVQFLEELCRQARAIEVVGEPDVRLSPEGIAYKSLMARIHYR